MPVVVADQEAAEAADGMTHGQARRRRGEHRHRSQPGPPHEHEARGEPAGEAAEPAHAAARRQQLEQRGLAGVLGRPEQLGAEQAADDAGDADVDDGVGQPGPARLAAQQPDADERAERDHDAEARDVERSDAEQNRVDRASCGAVRAPRAAAAARWR